MYGLKIGEVIRRRDLHARFGGQQQGGIATPSDRRLILAFTGGSGAQHGYDDGWDEGVFCYFGEGQVGPMEFIRGNRALRDHVGDRKALLLFKMEAKSFVCFMGAFVVASWEYRQQPDSKGQMRRAIVFHLAPAVQAEADLTEGADEGIPLSELRRRAQASGSMAPEATVSIAARTSLARSRDVAAYALARAAGTCESCDRGAPFLRVDGRPYLEVHHMNRLTDGGPDLPEGVAAVCPNCHRHIHYGISGARLNEELLLIIKAKEDRMSASANGMQV
ncbi:HNH endonuclease [Belnapia sp. T18]|uniref:HNH endonuclease n=1 Tax=Belnapia arida TaxID=2804533 RepID=A0ABS1U786_9PROT|nr:HNH endonuclease signature motif containing protein [Belnapia arida]MBL6080552.1 HNH endonuclease [Belnapia arida]